MSYTISLFPVAASSAHRHWSIVISLQTNFSGVLRVLVARFSPWLFWRSLPQPWWTPQLRRRLSAQPQPSSVADSWKTVYVVVFGTMRRPAKHIPVFLPASAGTDVCVDGRCRVHSVTVEPLFPRCRRDSGRQCWKSTPPAHVLGFRGGVASHRSSFIRDFTFLGVVRLLVLISRRHH